MMYPRSVGSFEASHEEFLGRSHSTLDRSLSAITAIFKAILQLRPSVHKSDLSLRERRESKLTITAAVVAGAQSLRGALSVPPP